MTSSDFLFVSILTLTLIFMSIVTKIPYIDKIKPPYGAIFIHVIIPLVGSLLFYFLLYLGLKKKLCNEEKEKFLFELPLSLQCEGYPYMQSSNPELLNKCKKFLSTKEGKMKYNDANCSGPYIGRPILSNYSQDFTLSNNNWENEMCNNK